MIIAGALKNIIISNVLIVVFMVLVFGLGNIIEFWLLVFHHEGKNDGF